MKCIGISQRVELEPKHKEKRDCLDQRWSSFLRKLGCMIMPLPNIQPTQAQELIDNFNLDAIILSGGNSIASIDMHANDTAHERDAFESKLIDISIERNIPMLGICRGMQMINVHLGGNLTTVDSHVNVRHKVFHAKLDLHLPGTVNSYHSWGISQSDLAKELDPITFDVEGNIEAFSHKKKKLIGIMWHPEREEPFNTLDINFIKDFLL